MELKTLPPELWLEIAQHVNGVLETVRFRSVCKLWRSSLPSPATLASKPSSIIPSPLDLTKSCLLEERTIYQVHGLRKYYHPFVVLEQVYSNENNSSNNNNDGTINKLKFRAYHLFHDSKTSSQEFPEELDVINNDGVFLSQVYTYYYIYTCGPKLNIVVNNDVMVALLDGKLAMLRRGAMQWKTIESKCKYDDVVVYNGKFFLVDRHGGGFIFDQNTLQVSKIVAPVHNRKNIYVTERKGYELVLCRKRLVMNFATGDLYLLILWRRSSQSNRVIIKVYKISEDGLKWNEIQSIGNRVIFIGRNFGFCFDVQDVKMLPYINYIVLDGSPSFPDYEGGKTSFWGNLDGYDLISVYNIRDEISLPPLRQSIYRVFN